MKPKTLHRLRLLSITLFAIHLAFTFIGLLEYLLTLKEYKDIVYLKIAFFFICICFINTFVVTLKNTKL